MSARRSRLVRSASRMTIGGTVPSEPCSRAQAISMSQPTIARCCRRARSASSLRFRKVAVSTLNHGISWVSFRGGVADGDFDAFDAVALLEVFFDDLRVVAPDDAGEGVFDLAALFVYIWLCRRKWRCAWADARGVFAGAVVSFWAASVDDYVEA